MNWVTFPALASHLLGLVPLPYEANFRGNRTDAHQKTPDKARTELPASSDGGAPVTAGEPRADAVVGVRTSTSLVVRVRGDRALFLCGAGRHRRLPGRVLQP